MRAGRGLRNEGITTYTLHNWGDQELRGGVNSSGEWPGEKVKKAQHSPVGLGSTWGAVPVEVRLNKVAGYFLGH